MSQSIKRINFVPQSLSDDSDRDDDEAGGSTKPVVADKSDTPGEDTPVVGKKRPLDDDWEDDPPCKVVVKDNHTAVVASHYNKLEERGLYERTKSRIFYMRNFNNWIKSILINKYINLIKEKAALGTPLRVMDMCCGKGGDLLKWSKANITHLICTDIAEVSVEQCEARYKSMIQKGDSGKIFTAEFFAADATLKRLREKYRDASIDLQLVSCQFAFHYSFESLKQAECMLKNAAECLKVGGYFIGTIPDTNEIMKRQRAAGTDSFGNDVYRISFLCDTEKPPLFGAKYNFQLDGVVDCPEFLVHFPTLTKLALKFGLKLVEKKRFDEFYEESISTGRGLIEKMQALETFPGQSRDDHERQSNRREYAHAEKFLDQKGGGGRFAKVGTLSKSEWEASTLYMFFAFQKMKTSWDKNGRPVYS
ncbi:mRNA cap guanine-N7 methyltransferase [Toxorhynchites rutilus septentrionalis]|uniref:mRNA cap guanine-N7 methyltransferase n=1 Tax=Toxorhynchites rutilus septentrionalis TaxID=329112 RepID=UPI002479558E|nr:mRNA cap guanine-N7 methyltransferase [Toxorhynchites rutilus septentrionalis]XP_055638648.1 mRNA cap guanine-N7 methyltransferase [Toxorhynchites rutilus septentrionalis]